MVPKVLEPLKFFFLYVFGALGKLDTLGVFLKNSFLLKPVQEDVVSVTLLCINRITQSESDIFDAFGVIKASK